MKNKIYFVTATDSFMTGWGSAKDIINKIIFICFSYQEAEIVFNNLKNRQEMKYVNICFNRPKYLLKNEFTLNNLDSLEKHSFKYKNKYLVDILNKNSSPNFYKENYF